MILGNNGTLPIEKKTFSGAKICLMTGYTGFASTDGFTLYFDNGLVCTVSERGVQIRERKRGLHPLLILALSISLAGVLGALLQGSLPRLWTPNPGLSVGVVILLALLFLWTPLGGRLRRWHGAEHQTINALEQMLSNPEISPEEAFDRSPWLHPYCGTVAIGMALPLLPLAFLWPPLAFVVIALVAYLHAQLPPDHALRTPGLLFQRLLTAPVGARERAASLEALRVLKERGLQATQGYLAMAEDDSR